MDYTQKANYKLFLGINGTLSNRLTPLSTTYQNISYKNLDLKIALPTLIFPKSNEPNNSTIINLLSPSRTQEESHLVGAKTSQQVESQATTK
jgi:hypothetical protein